MQIPVRRKMFASCLLLSALVHLVVLWLTDQWGKAGEDQTVYTLTLSPLTPPTLEPFKRPHTLFVPRPLVAPKRLGYGRELQQPAVAATEKSSSFSAQDLDAAGIGGLVSASQYVVAAEGGVPSYRWEDSLAQAWGDSAAVFLARREPEKEDYPLDPFASAAELENHRTVVRIDPQTGKLVQAHWFLPAYHEQACDGCRWYNDALKHFRKSLKEVTQGISLPRVNQDTLPGADGIAWQPIPLVSELVTQYRLHEQPIQKVHLVQPDSIHSFGMFAYRDILDYEELKKYPLVLLKWIDPQDTGEIVRYLIDGGFVVASLPQLNLLEGALRQHVAQGLPHDEVSRKTMEHLEGRGIHPDDPYYQDDYQMLYEAEVQKSVDAHLRRINIWSGHPLMNAYYALGGYYPVGNHNDPPIQGLELEGRLVAVNGPQDGASPLFVNTVVFGLIQPSDMGGRYPSR